jgi:hypothetical protein
MSEPYLNLALSPYNTIASQSIFNITDDFYFVMARRHRLLLKLVLARRAMQRLRRRHLRLHFVWAASCVHNSRVNDTLMNVLNGNERLEMHNANLQAQLRQQPLSREFPAETAASDGGLQQALAANVNLHRRLRQVVQQSADIVQDLQRRVSQLEAELASNKGAYTALRQRADVIAEESRIDNARRFAAEQLLSSKGFAKLERYLKSDALAEIASRHCLVVEPSVAPHGSRSSAGARAN